MRFIDCRALESLASVRLFPPFSAKMRGLAQERIALHRTEGPPPGLIRLLRGRLLQQVHALLQVGEILFDQLAVHLPIKPQKADLRKLPPIRELQTLSQTHISER